MPGTVTIEFIPGSAELFAEFTYFTSKDRTAAIEHFKTVAAINTITIKPSIFYEDQLELEKKNTRHFPIDQLI